MSDPSDERLAQLQLDAWPREMRDDLMTKKSESLKNVAEKLGAEGTQEDRRKPKPLSEFAEEGVRANERLRDLGMERLQDVEILTAQLHGSDVLQVQHGPS